MSLLSPSGHFFLYCVVNFPIVLFIILLCYVFSHYVIYFPIIFFNFPLCYLFPYYVINYPIMLLISPSAYLFLYCVVNFHIVLFVLLLLLLFYLFSILLLIYPLCHLFPIILFISPLCYSFSRWVTYFPVVFIQFEQYCTVEIPLRVISVESERTSLTSTRAWASSSRRSTSSRRWRGRGHPVLSWSGNNRNHPSTDQTFSTEPHECRTNLWKINCYANLFIWGF